eukprot:TRINITY_DN94021_c0_g1_i1.p1 TRINITY_DN94021_c0_g1~~TRINITY_DN94021_c0_g1_i1.p1  ORF type:complete len:596 (-),score=79.86 TRINITY_DN94021_c0_g1_i1:93-1808(-)
MSHGTVVFFLLLVTGQFVTSIRVVDSERAPVDETSKEEANELDGLSVSLLQRASQLKAYVVRYQNSTPSASASVANKAALAAGNSSGAFWVGSGVLNSTETPGLLLSPVAVASWRLAVTDALPHFRDPVLLLAAFSLPSLLLCLSCGRLCSWDADDDDHPSRPCGCLDLRDTPVMMLPGLFFGMPILSAYVSLILGLYAAMNGILMSAVMTFASWQMGHLWRRFGVMCMLSALVSLPVSRLFATLSHRWYAGIIAVALYSWFLLTVSLVLRYFDSGLVGSSADHAAGWNEKAADLMRYGFSWRQRDYPKRLSQDLIYDRKCWSGEPASDYAFYIANHHFYLGCFLAHPAHPFAKESRVCLLLVILQLVVFPTAVFQTMIEQPLARMLVILLIVKLPRSLLKVFMTGYIIDTEREVVGERSTSSEKWQRGARKVSAVLSARLHDAVKAKHDAEVRFWYLVLSAGALAVATGISIGCWYYLQANAERPNALLLKNLDSLAFAFVLDMPLLTMQTSSMFFINVGFFYNWAEEHHDWILRQGEEDVSPNAAALSVAVSGFGVTPRQSQEPLPSTD